MNPPIPRNESERLEALRELCILDTAPEQVYEDLTQLAALLCRAPYASITLVDEDRQWFKSAVGLSERETPRSSSFCAHAIMEPDVFVMPDATQDDRFRQNPLVLGPPYIRSYLGMPLISPAGYALGTLCVIDTKPREFSPLEHTALRVLARQVVAHFEIRRQMAELQHLNAERARAERKLRRSRATLRLANWRLKEIAASDPLTGLRNRRSFDARLRREWKLSARLNTPLSVLMLDVDHFKQVNDTRGHSFGDEVLKHVASILKSGLRETDLVARFGGEEFSLLLPATNHQSALKVAEHLRNTIAARPYEDLSFSASIGVATGTASLVEIESCPLLEQADAALYAAKRGGRNRVVSADTIDPPLARIPA